MNSPRCVAAAELSGGLWLDLCNPNPDEWREAMRRMSEAAFGEEARIELSAQPADRNGDWLIDDRDIEPRLAGRIRSSRVPSGRGWWYDDAPDSILLDTKTGRRRARRSR